MKKLSKKDSLKLLEQMYLGAFQNGFDFIKDAKTLYEENESYGHAFGLLVLAEEEFGKSYFVWICYEMIKNDICYFTDDERALKISELIYNHKFKHAMMEILKKKSFILLTKKNLPDINNLSDVDMKITLENISDEISGETDPDKQKILKDIEKEYEPLQRLRELGFYVDFDKEKYKIKGPENILKQDCFKQYHRTNASMLFCHMSITQKLDKRFVPVIKQRMKEAEESES